MADYGLAGVRPECGCVTAALSLRFASQKDVRDFYESMAETGREVRRMDSDVIRAKWGDCPHEKPEQEQKGRAS